MTRPVAAAERAATNLANIAELVRRTTASQGLPAELENPIVAHKVAALSLSSAGPPETRRRPPGTGSLRTESLAENVLAHEDTHASAVTS